MVAMAESPSLIGVGALRCGRGRDLVDRLLTEPNLELDDEAAQRLADQLAATSLTEPRSLREDLVLAELWDRAGDVVPLGSFWETKARSVATSRLAAAVTRFTPANALTFERQLGLFEALAHASRGRRFASVVWGAIADALDRRVDLLNSGRADLNDVSRCHRRCEDARRRARTAEAFPVSRRQLHQGSGGDGGNRTHE